MAELLSSDWLSAVERALAGRSGAGRDEGPVVVQVAVTAPKAPDARWWVRCAPEGVTVGGGTGTEEAAVTVSVGRQDLVALLDGSLPVDVGFMQGRVKVDGATAPVLALLAWTAGDDFAAARQMVAEATEGG